MTSAALISLVDLLHADQHHWWLSSGGLPPRVAALLAAPLHRTGSPASCGDDFIQIFLPLESLAASQANLASRQADFRYLICLQPRGPQLSCWRRYPEAAGWQRRCGPLPLRHFIAHFCPPPLNLTGPSDRP